MVGRAWCGLLTAHRIPYRAYARPEFDLDRPGSLADLVRPGDDLVILAAAWTDVDGAENDEAAAMRANAESPGRLAAACAAINATLIHYSTDYVFQGEATRPYPIDAPIQPINAYGRSKAAGEDMVRVNAPDHHLLIRTSWVYAPWGKNFVRTIAKHAAQKQVLRVVNDQRGRPTSAEQLAVTSMGLYRRGAQGTWHATDGGECTWHGLASETVRLLGLPCRVEPCTSAEYPRPAPRPAFSTLETRPTEGLVGLVSWESSLARVVARLDADS